MIRVAFTLGVLTLIGTAGKFVSMEERVEARLASAITGSGNCYDIITYDCPSPVDGCPDFECEKVGLLYTCKSKEPTSPIDDYESCGQVDNSDGKTNRSEVPTTNGIVCFRVRNCLEECVLQQDGKRYCQSVGGPSGGKKDCDAVFKDQHDNPVSGCIQEYYCHGVDCPDLIPEPL